MFTIKIDGKAHEVITRNRAQDLQPRYKGKKWGMPDRIESKSDVLKVAIERVGEISARNIRKKITLHDNGKQVWRAYKKYADDDPIWKAPLSIEDCRTIYREVVTQAIKDAVLGNTNVRAKRERGPAQKFIKSQVFKDYLDIAGYTQSAVLRRLREEYPEIMGDS